MKWSTEIVVALIAVAVPLLAALGACFRWLTTDRNEKAYERGWERVAELEEEVRLLRIALHKATQRSNDGWTISEVLSLALQLPLEDRIRIVRQVREMIERSLGVGA